MMPGKYILVSKKRVAIILVTILEKQPETAMFSAQLDSIVKEEHHHIRVDLGFIYSFAKSAWDIYPYTDEILRDMIENRIVDLL